MRWLAVLLALALAAPVAAQERPEHTLAAYERAIDQGADHIAVELVATRDGVLVARHENELSATTDVDQRPEFASLLTTREIDGREVTGWFTEDFALPELHTLRAIERQPELRPQSAAFDGLYQVPTLAEIIQLVRAKEAETGRSIGLHFEVRNPEYFEDIGFDLAAMLARALHAAGYTGADDSALVQSHEIERSPTLSPPIDGAEQEERETRSMPIIP